MAKGLSLSNGHEFAVSCFSSAVLLDGRVGQEKGNAES